MAGWKKNPSTGESFTIRGYLVGDPDKSLPDEEDFSDDDEFDFSQGTGTSIKKESLRRVKMSLQPLDGNQPMKQIVGKFPLFGQWWETTIVSKKTYGKLIYTDGVPSYRLRTDLATRGTIFLRFIGMMKLQEIEKKILLDYIRHENINVARLYELNNLTKVVQDCAAKQITDGEKNSILALNHIISHNENIRQTSLALRCPVTYMSLPVLLPKQFHSIIKHCTGPNGDMDFLPQVEKILVHSPWELAFTPVFVRKTLKRLPEVTPNSFEKAKLWTGMRQPYRDAVMLYYVLKDHCRDTGDTYMNVHRLNGQSTRFKSYTLSKFREALTYLVESKVVIEEGERIYPVRLHQAECDISHIITDLLMDKNPFKFEVDISKEPLSILAGDRDQCAAARMISEKPVVVMSGRGGCGKTEVVARVCKVALEEILKQKIAEHKLYQDDLFMRYTQHRRKKKVNEKEDTKKEPTEKDLLSQYSEKITPANVPASDSTVVTASASVESYASSTAFLDTFTETSCTTLTEETSSLMTSTIVVDDDDASSSKSSNLFSEVDDSDRENSFSQDENDAVDQSIQSCEENVPVPGNGDLSVTLDESLAGTGDQSLVGTGDQSMEGSGDKSMAGSGDKSIAGTGNQSMTRAGDQPKVGTGDQFTTDSPTKSASYSVESLEEDKAAQQYYKEFLKRHAYIFEENCSAKDVTTKQEIDEELEKLYPFIKIEEFPPEPDKSMKSYILMTAPTGKAGKVLGKRAGVTGYTIHQVLWRYMLWQRDPDGQKFPFAQVSILVIDECSLVAVQNLAFLLSIMRKYAELKRVIFLGDIHQLPSIEPGNFLIDIYSGLHTVEASISLRTNHRSEGRLIVSNALRISSRTMPEMGPAFNMLHIGGEHVDLARDEAVMNLIESDKFSDDKTSQFVAFRRIDCEAINNICSKQYTGHICTDSTTKRPIFQKKFKICCTKNGTVPVMIIHMPGDNPKKTEPVKTSDPTTSYQDANHSNTFSDDQMIDDDNAGEEEKDWLDDYLQAFIVERIQKSAGEEETEEPGAIKVEQLLTSVNRSSTTISPDKSDTSSKDKKIQLQTPKKNDSKKKTQESRSREMRLCNGEIFWLKEIYEEREKSSEGKSYSAEYWILEDEDGVILRAKKSILMRECRMKPCWCRTIHTYQGSEIKHLAYVVGAAGRQNWQHVYTAVTRGKSSVSIIGETDQLQKAVRTANSKRCSSLEERLRETLDPNYKTQQEDEIPDFDEADDIEWNDLNSSPVDDFKFNIPPDKPFAKCRKRKRGGEIAENSSFDAFSSFKENFSSFTSAKTVLQKDIPACTTNIPDNDPFSDDSDESLLVASQQIEAREKTTPKKEENSVEHKQDEPTPQQLTVTAPCVVNISPLELTYSEMVQPDLPLVKAIMLSPPKSPPPPSVVISPRRTRSKSQTAKPKQRNSDLKYY